jgi:phage-related protein
MPDIPNLASKGMDDKRIVWIGSSRDDLRRFPKEVQRKAGYQLRLVQQGKEPDDFKPMPSVGPGAYEIRVQLGDAYRVFYVVKFEEAVYVLHAFQKKTQKTARRDIEIGRQRYSAVQNRRRAGP